MDESPGRSAGRLAVVVADGVPDRADRAHLDGADLVVAADGGAAWLVELGRRPDVVVGDMDSLDAGELAGLEAAGARIVRHPAEKDASDTELAVAEALAAGAGRVTVLGALAGERLDHELANLLLLADAQFTGRQVRIVRGETLVRALSGGNALRIEAQRGDTVTLLPIGGPAVGVTTEGLRYPLDGETLPVGSSLGLSNEVVRDGASVRLGEGSLLVIEIGRTTKGAR